MSVVSADQINDIKNRIDIAQVITPYVQLKRLGKNLRGLCPFHNERTPSFYVQPDKGSYHCFGCQASGDAIQFLMSYEHLSFADSIQKLADIAGVQLEKNVETDIQKSNRQKRDFLYKVGEYISDYFVYQLNNHNNKNLILNYLDSRKIENKSIVDFKLGYAPNDVNDLIYYIKSKKIPIDYAVELGVLLQKEDKSYYYRFAHRLIFPIWNEKGHICGFGGRLISNQKDLPKYINSSESIVFKKSQLFYGYHLAKNAIAKNNQAILCEGYFDVIRLHQSGFNQAIAPLGTAFTENHVPLLKRLTKHVVTLFDGDSAGQKASQKAAELLLKAQLSVKIVSLPAGEDPDSFLQKFDADILKTQIEEAPTAIEHLITQAAAGVKTSIESRMQAVAKITPWLRLITSELERELYVREAARRLGIAEDALRHHFQTPAVTQNTKPEAPPLPSEAPLTEAVCENELYAVCEILKYRVAWDILPNLLPLIRHAGLSLIVQQCIDDDHELTFEFMHQNLGNTRFVSNLNDALAEDLSGSLAPKQIAQLKEDICLKLEHAGKERLLWELTRQIEAQAAQGVAVSAELLQQKRALNAWIKRSHPRRRSGI